VNVITFHSILYIDCDCNRQGQSKEVEKLK